MSFNGRLWSVAVLVIAVVLLALSGSSLVADYRGYQQAREIKKERTAARDALIAERDRVLETVEQLKNDPSTREGLVRTMGYSKPGEYIYLVTKKSTASTTKTDP
ncbi:MAG: septum formation initiator family protein [Candidatus Poribacteria bacterium]|nr:septum formation initiator family protein [Candidatus Poribacteria bacterium]